MKESFSFLMIFYTRVPKSNLNYLKQEILNFDLQMELTSFVCNWDFLIAF